MKSAIASVACLLLMQSADFQNCNVAQQPPHIATARDLPGYQVFLDLSQQALINARNECSMRRAADAEIIKKLKRKEAGND